MHQPPMSLLVLKLWQRVLGALEQGGLLGPCLGGSVSVTMSCGLRGLQSTRSLCSHPGQWVVELLRAMEPPGRGCGGI